MITKKNLVQRIGLISATTTLIASCGGGGNSENVTQIPNPVNLTKSGAVSIMGEGLKSIVPEAVVQVGFSPLETITCHNLGNYSLAGEIKKVCQIYGIEGIEGVPKFSPNGIDLVSRIPQGTEEEVRTSSLSDLNNATWGPVLNSETINLVSLKVGDPILGVFNLKGSGSVYGNCDIVNSQGNIVSGTGSLIDNGTIDGVTSLNVSSPNGYSLADGTYDFNCTFSDLNGSSKIDGAAKLQVLSSNNAPVISLETPINLEIGQSGNLGGTCTDIESGNLSLTPSVYTPINQTAEIIIRTCTDGINTVTFNQTITGICATGTAWTGSECAVPVNNVPVINNVVSPLESIIGQSGNLGGTCTDIESGNLSLTPSVYTSTSPNAVNIVRTCTDGINTVTSNQTITGICATGTAWYDSACRAPIACVGNYQNTGTCSNSSGPGFLIQTYSILTQAKYGGALCPANEGDTKVGTTACDTTPTPPPAPPTCPPGMDYDSASGNCF